MKPVSRPSCDEVLDAFAVEPATDRSTLEHYLREYPEYAAELVDLAGELSRDIVVNEAPLRAEDREMIAAAWKQHGKAEPRPAADPFSLLSTADLRKAAEMLEVPRQVLTAFRDRAVIVASVPNQFLGQLASAIGSKVDALTAYLEAPSGLSLARRHKADSKPKVGQRVTFKQLLVDSGVSPETQKKLMPEH